MFERLTIKTDICIEPENEIVYHNPNDPDGMYNILDLAECLYSGGEAEAGILMEISRRLAAYEDSQMTPEEVQSLAKAKADGRLVMLPVKVGDTVYIAVKEWDARYCLKSSFVPCVREGTVAHMCISHKGIIVCVTVKGEYSEYYEFGKTVFLTREEAEKALGGGQG